MDNPFAGRPILKPREAERLEAIAGDWLPRGLRTGAADVQEAGRVSGLIIARFGQGLQREVINVRSPIEGVVAATVIGGACLEKKEFRRNDRFLAYEGYQAIREWKSGFLLDRGASSIEVALGETSLMPALERRLGPAFAWWTLRNGMANQILADLEGPRIEEVWKRVETRVTRAVGVATRGCRKHLDDFRDQAYMGWFGQFEPHLLAVMDFARQIGQNLGAAALWLDLGTTCSMAWMVGELAIICDSPTLLEHDDEAGVPARFTRLAYADGWELRLPRATEPPPA